MRNVTGGTTKSGLTENGCCFQPPPPTLPLHPGAFGLASSAMNERIVTDPNICSGKPVIRGTRIMVRNILGLVAGGYTVDRIL